jgi:hypothetical protein
MDTATARLDPALQTTVALARAEGLVSYNTSQKVVLTDLGIRLVDELRAVPVLSSEKEYLTSLGKLTESGLLRTLGALSE